jgi:osmoprotectant transport system substrate-binding protein
MSPDGLSRRIRRADLNAEAPGTPLRRAFIAGALIAFLSLSVPFAALAQTVVIGGKDFTEQLLMAEMTGQLLQAKGFEVEVRSGYDTPRLRNAQEQGFIDIYWEYTGTSLREFNKINEPLSPAETYARVKQLDAAKNLVWLKPSRVNNTYALAMRRVDAQKREVTTISELAARVQDGERFVFASNAEFYERSDGLRPLERTYGFEFGRDRVVRLDTDRIYQVLRDLNVIDVGLVFSTDGRIPAFNLLVLKDDKEFFPNYAMAPVVRRQILEQYPDLAQHLERLAALLDNETMARLNSMVVIDKLRVKDAASDFLRSKGLL